MALERLSSSDRKRQIAEAALQILASQGAPSLTAKVIANAVGVTDAAVFRHYRDKSEIVSAAISHFEELLAGDTVDLEGVPLSRLGAFFVRRLNKARQHPEILRLAFNDRLAEVAGPEGSAQVQRVVGRSLAFVHDCVEAAQREGAIAADVPSELLVWAVIGCLRGAATSVRGRTAAQPAEAAWASLEQVLRRSAVPARARSRTQGRRRRGRS